MAIIFASSFSLYRSYRSFSLITPFQALAQSSGARCRAVAIGFHIIGSPTSSCSTISVSFAIYDSMYAKKSWKEFGLVW